MTVAYIIDFDVKPERIDTFLDMVNAVLSAMRHEENFLECALNQDPDNPARFMLYEAWADHEDVLDVQLKRPYRQAWHDALPDLLAAPRTFSIWKPLRSLQGPASLAE
jgi:quinol monooxygenase YgiN